MKLTEEQWEHHERKLQELEDAVLWLMCDEDRQVSILGKRVTTYKNRLERMIKNEQLQRLEWQAQNDKNTRHLWTQFTEDRDRQWKRINDDDAAARKRHNIMEEQTDKHNKEIGWLYGLMVVALILILVLLVAVAN
jgi:hypothetical protein